MEKNPAYLEMGLPHLSNIGAIMIMSVKYILVRRRDITPLFSTLKKV